MGVINADGLVREESGRLSTSIRDEPLVICTWSYIHRFLIRLYVILRNDFLYSTKLVLCEAKVNPCNGLFK